MNHFVFINWLWSGIYAARQFSKELSKWQAQSLRFVGIEVLARDLYESETTHRQQYQGSGEGSGGKASWEELCFLWQGVHVLRMAVKGNVNRKGAARSNSHGITFRPEEQAFAAMMTGIEMVEDKGVLDVNSAWVRHGLCAMNSLEWIEIEIDDESVPREEKLRFCEELGRLLSHGRQDNVKVMLVEIVEAESIPS